MIYAPQPTDRLERNGIRNDTAIATLKVASDDPAALPQELISTGLCDLQVNGFASVDFNNPNLSADGLEFALQQMLKTGVTRCLPTVISASLKWQSACFAALEAARAKVPLAQQMIAGYHLEGPFLNPEPGYCGCHPAAAMIAGDWDYYRTLQSRANGRIRLITVAPEMPLVLPLIERWVADGVAVALGHTGADYETVLGAAAYGATLSTHLGNATPAQLNKRDNIVLSQLAIDALSASVIADGYHLRQHVLGVYLRAKGADRIVLITDATAGAAAPPGRYTLGEIDLVRDTEPRVRLPGEDALAGSATTLDQCLRNTMTWFQTPMSTSIQWASENPRRIVGLPPTPVTGEPVEWVWWEQQTQGYAVNAAQVGEHRWAA